MSKEYLFKSKNGVDESKLSGPVGECKASKVLMDVLAMGDVPDGLALRHAKSYNAHYIARKGKNALGFFDTKDLLVINGIADELEKEGIKGVIQPSTSKNYRAIRLNDLSDADLQTLTNTIARVLGFKSGASGATGTAKAGKKGKKGKKKNLQPNASPAKA